MTNKGKKTTNPYHHGDLRNALIQAGLEILSEEGANALSLRKVAKKAGVSHAAPYRHFADKETLIAAIAEEGFHKLTERMKEGMINLSDVPGDPPAQLVEVGWVYIQFALDNPDHLRVMFGGVIEKHDAYPALQSASKEAFAQLIAVIQTLQDREYIVKGLPIQLAVAMWSMLHGLAVLLIENQIPTTILEETPKEQIIQICIKTLFEGLGERGDFNSHEVAL